MIDVTFYHKTTIELFCTERPRDKHGERDGDSRKHLVTLEDGDPWPDGDTMPCPMDGCDGVIRLRPETNGKAPPADKSDG